MLELIGIKLDFSFSWYIHGPYSPDLTRTLFTIPQNVPRKCEPLTRGEKERIDAFKDFMGESLKSAKEMELMGSLFYVYRTYRQTGAQDEQVLKAFMERKPFFSEEAVRKAWTRLAQLEKLM